MDFVFASFPHGQQSNLDIVSTKRSYDSAAAAAEVPVLGLVLFKTVARKRLHQHFSFWSLNLGMRRYGATSLTTSTKAVCNASCFSPKDAKELMKALLQGPQAKHLPHGAQFSSSWFLEFLGFLCC